jgi:aminoglycoside phosphotransferase family enzyme/predicted kinase
VAAVRLVETHISWVFLTGAFAYKVKKPLRLEFLDFSSLECRRHFCAEEVRLNRRFAPELYLGVVPIGGTPGQPRVGDSSTAPQEWAVQLVQFDEADRLDARCEAGRLSADDCRLLGTEIARVEATLAVADAGAGHGTPERLRAVFAMNVAEIARLRPDLAGRTRPLEAWFGGRLERDRGAFLSRIAAGRIRECHGDLHLANLVLLDGRPVAFDAIEFNADLRWIDVASDVAFLTMDLEGRGRPELAAHVTSAWMEESGDHAAAAVLPPYRVARAVVRAAVAAIRGAQEGVAPEVAAAAAAETDRHLALAERLTAPPAPVMLVVTGVAGSGKSWLARLAVGLGGAVRLSSDVERKRLAAMRPTDRPSDAAATRALYGEPMTRAVYARLAGLAHDLLVAGSSVVIDATCNARWQRDLLAAAAARARAPLAWLDIALPEATLRERVARRASQGGDPSDATVDVLRAQLAAREPLEDSEGAPHGARPVLCERLGAVELAEPERMLEGVIARLRAATDGEEGR